MGRRQLYVTAIEQPITRPLAALIELWMGNLRARERRAETLVRPDAFFCLVWLAVMLCCSGALFCRAWRYSRVESELCVYELLGMDMWRGVDFLFGYFCIFLKPSDRFEVTRSVADTCGFHGCFSCHFVSYFYVIDGERILFLRCFCLHYLYLMNVLFNFVLENISMQNERKPLVI